MKIDEFNSIFKDFSFAQQYAEGKKEIKSSQFIESLFKYIKSEKDQEASYNSFFKTASQACLSQDIAIAKVAKRLCQKMKQGHLDYMESSSSLSSIVESEKTEKKQEVEPVKQQKIDYASFPEESIDVLSLTKRASQEKSLKAMIETLKKRSKTDDPDVALIPHKDAEKHKDICLKSYPYDKNRAGRQESGFFINASEVAFNEKKFVIAACPKNLELVRDYFKYLIQANVNVLISLHQVDEVGPESAFWDQRVLSQLKFADGTVIRKTGYRVIATDQNPSLPRELKEKAKELSETQLKKWRPRILECTLTVTQGQKKRKITLLHYLNWHYGDLVPSTVLLNTLLDRKDELLKPGDTLAVNCQEGHGRSGITVICDVARQYIQDQLALDKTLDPIDKKLKKIKINIPEIVYEFRKGREMLVGVNRAAYVGIYKVIEDYARGLIPKITP